MTIDTILCSSSGSQTFFLQDLINCDGPACEGQWIPDPGNTGITFDPCRNAVTAGASPGCGTFVLESDGTGPNNQCGAFRITVNIELAGNPALTLSPDPSVPAEICETEVPPAMSVSLDTSPYNTITYQWQSSANSLVGWANIAGATGSTYTPTTGINDTTFYRVLLNFGTSCSGGTCDDTSIYITVNTLPCPMSLGDTVWYDLNVDGIQDGGLEVGIDGVELALFADNGGGFAPANDRDGVPVANTFTAGGGAYTFENLAPGDYQVRIVPTNWDPGQPFGTGGLYEGAFGTTGQGGDDGNNTDDNGDNDFVVAPPAGISSGTINLALRDEDTRFPTSDAFRDGTVDFGIALVISFSFQAARA
jgi:hypothetical protein